MVIGCTNGNRIIELDDDGKIVWSVTNEDIGENLFNDACGAQRLPNGNTVISSRDESRLSPLSNPDDQRNAGSGKHVEITADIAQDIPAEFRVTPNDRCELTSSCFISLPNGCRMSGIEPRDTPSQHVSNSLKGDS